MEVVDKVQQYISNWENGGSDECHNLITIPHSNPSDPDCSDVLTTVYHTLFVSTLQSWLTQKALTVDAFINFVQSMLERLPSSSLATSKSPNVTLFGELLVDVVWSIDAELDEILADAKLSLSNADPSNLNVEGASLEKEALKKRLEAKEKAETDKETLTVIIKQLLSHGILNADVCRERLDMSLIANAGLIADKTAFDRKEIRTRTSLFYKQNKFNLLREQSEGYSKLVTELTSCLGPPHSSATGYPTESRAAIKARARPAWDRVVGLIGYFDLDPNRALDIILDVFSTHLATHHSFFTTFLSFSPWSLRPQNSHTPNDEDSMPVEPDPERYRGKSLDEILALAEDPFGKSSGTAASTSRSHSSNSRVLAQVLGFKFAHYQFAEVTEPTPQNLYLMAAILIREGFISLEELYPHITPTEEGMEALHQSYLNKIEERISAAKISQLAMAAPLESSGSTAKAKPAVPSEPKKSNEPKEVPNQKFGLLNALLSVGALRPAIAIMSKFPWMVDAFPEIADLMIRVLKHSLAALYESSTNGKDWSTSFTQPRARFGSTGVISAPERRPHLTLWAPTPPSTTGVDFVFFFPDWIERVPVCSTMDDLVDVVEPLMRFIGLHVSRDPAYLTKFLRLGRAHVASTVTIDPETKKQVGTPDPEHPTRSFWFKVLRRYLLPALPLIRGNAVCTVDVWNIIRQYETTLRWQLYGEWKSSTYLSHPELRVRQVQSDRESKGILRRLSHNTIDSLSGTVAKLAHSNPCIFFVNAVHQIMAYDNLAGVVIQALNYVTIMGFDVLVYIILDAMANPNKDRVKDDGVNTSDWLQSLASFTGMLFRRYSADLTPLLKYIVHQLHNGQTTEIIVLRELIWKMAGIEPLPSLSDSQIVAMAGGPTLRIEAVASSTRGARLDPGDAVLKGPQRLGKTLLESSLASPLLIQVAQQRQSCVFQAPNAHLKSLASLYDATHGVLLQYLDLLTSPSVISPQDYAEKVVPSLTELNEMYGICAPICMQIIRPMLHVKLLSAALEMQEKERLASEEAEKRLKAALTAKREPNTSSSRVASPSIGEVPPSTETMSENKISGTEAQSMDVSMDPSDGQIAAGTENPWLPELYPLFEDVKKIAPGNAAEVIGAGFYLSFWQLSTYDLAPPAAKYDEETAALRTLSRQEDSKYIAADRSADRARRQTAYTHRDKRNRYNTYVNMLGQEFKEQAAARAFTIKRLAREKQHWFAHNPKAAVLASSLIEHCLQPRSLLSPMDADFCAQFIKVIHMQGTPGFSTLMCYDKILGDHIKVVVFSCSEYEARNYGRFLLGVLTDLSKWFQDEQLFLQENRTKSGGKTIFLPGLQRRWSQKAVIAAEDIITWQDFKLIVRKWHRKLCKCLLDCIDTGEFMHVYNAIIVLKEILPVFPVAAVNEWAGGSLNMAMERFLEKETRGDLKILGRAYTASLKKREPIWIAPKPLPTAASSSVASKSTASSVDKGRTNTPPTLPNSGTPDESRQKPAGPPTSTPSAPRAQPSTLNGTTHTANGRTNITPTKLAIESIPRPEVVKRVRPELRVAEDRKDGGDVKTIAKADAMDIDVPIQQSGENTLPPTAPDASTRNVELDASASKSQPSLATMPSPSPSKDLARVAQLSRPSTPNQVSSGRPGAGREVPKSPRSSADQKALRPESHQTMPPPSIPSQTMSAEKLRETAKYGRGSSEDKTGQFSSDVRGQPSVSSPSPASSRRRSPSPSSRPGTRNPSLESRASGGHRPSRDGDRADDKRSPRENRQDFRDASRRDTQTHGRGERTSRSARENDREKDSERDRERGRDRHGERERVRDKDRERERDRDKDRDRDRERDRDRDRERERDRDRDRDRDRHRRDEKDRDRDSRKERDGAPRGSSAVTPVPLPDDRGLPVRPDPPRHRESQHGDEALGKRRRPTDEERASRKESHHEERSRRSSEKDGRERARDSERRRKDRDHTENESNKILSVDTKFGDKRIPEGPASAKSLPPTTPSAPRAMAAGDNSRLPRSDSTSGRDREWKPRELSGHATPSGPANAGIVPPSEGGGSLRARIGEKEVPRGPPHAPSSYRSENAADRKLDISGRDDERDGSRKRTLSERDKDSGDPTSNASEQTSQPPKRPRINRNRYTAAPTHGFAKKTLPIDVEKTRAGRNN